MVKLHIAHCFFFQKNKDTQEKLLSRSTALTRHRKKQNKTKQKTNKQKTEKKKQTKKKQKKKRTMTRRNDTAGITDITKTCLFKYTEKFTTKKMKDKNSDIFFIFLLKT